nr:Mu transposase C-terminal domain-containing protein [Deinococcus arboris]
MRLCRERGLEAPHYNTVRNRIAERTQYVQVAKRLGKKTAENRFRPHVAEFPGADYPLSVIQIDHTKLDVILVDYHHRLPLGRPWLTLALDLRTRLVAGYWLSFDAPSALSVGLCLLSVILPKSGLLAKHGLDAKWPIQGLPRTIHLDNAKEFHGQMLERACQQYGIDIQYRPKGQPHMGGHIERMMDTLATLIHELPGTTFHHPKDRGEYRSEAQAAFTLAEFEQVLLTQITRVYHERFHQGIQTTPLKRYELDVLGTSSRPGLGLVLPNVDLARLKYDFLPFFEHTIQNYGILYKHIHYFADVLKPWIDASDPGYPQRKRKFLSRYDPRDMSTIYFYDPELQQYFPIPFRDSSRPAQVSLWELRAATQRVREEGKAQVDEDTIFAAYAELRRMEAAAKQATKRQRRHQQRRATHTPVHQEVEIGQPLVQPSSSMDEDLPELEGFDDVEVVFG